MQIHFSTQQNLAAENLLVCFEQDDQLTDKLRAFLQQYNIVAEAFLKDFKAEAKETHVFYKQKAKIYVLGLGKKMNFKSIFQIFRTFFFQQRYKLHHSLWIDCQAFDATMIEAMLNGMLLSHYEISLYKTDFKTEPLFLNNNAQIEIAVMPTLLAEAKNILTKTYIIAEAQRQMMDLVNLPPNKKIPFTLVNWAKQSAQKHGYKVQILDKNALENNKLEAVIAVGKGSANPPYMIIAEHKPANYKHTIGLVGKGITFDTGGLSIKDDKSMYYMKSDMGGAAAVLGVMEIVARLELPIRLIVVVPTAENSIDAQAFKPSDVIGSYSGKTIEITNTDAEGRLILADGLAYLNRHYKPDYLIDLATLTGNCVMALGYEAAGLFTTNDNLATQLTQAGEVAGEYLWRLPMWDSYKEMINSDIADVRNYSGRGLAGAIEAAKFLEVFTEQHPQYAHIDIAGTAFGDTEFAKTKIATAFGVRLIYQFLKQIAES